MKRILIFALALLGGCATYADRQSETPGFVWQSALTPDEFVGCAYPKLFDQISLFNRLSLVPDGNTRVVTMADAFGTTIFTSITATPTRSGSTISIRGIGAATGWNNVKACL
jgi:hypothetical protein